MKNILYRSFLVVPVILLLSLEYSFSEKSSGSFRIQSKSKNGQLCKKLHSVLRKTAGKKSTVQTIETKEIARKKGTWFFQEKEVYLADGHSLKNAVYRLHKYVNRWRGVKIQEQAYSKNQTTVHFFWHGKPFARVIIYEKTARSKDPDGLSDPPLIAFVIDDLGYNLKALPQAMLINSPITFAVLPSLAYSERLAEKLHNKGQEIMLHLPMEPENPEMDPGKGAIKTDMSDEEIELTVRENLQRVPYILGVNNHMGSKATKNERVLKLVLSEIKEKGLFFLDSLTSQSKVKDVTSSMSYPVLQRDVFIDNEKENTHICNQIRKLMYIAEKKGKAIGIGHFHSQTLNSILNMIPEIEARGIKIVFVSEFFETEKAVVLKKSNSYTKKESGQNASIGN